MNLINIAHDMDFRRCRKFPPHEKNRKKWDRNFYFEVLMQICEELIQNSFKVFLLEIGLKLAKIWTSQGVESSLSLVPSKKLK